MKLTRKQLTHAKDVQLAAVGIKRKGNSGWLKKALEREFTNREVAQFEFATRTTKRVGKFLISVDPEKESKGTKLAAEIRSKTNGMFHKQDQQKEIDRLRADLKIASDALVFTGNTLDTSQGTPASQIPIAATVMDALKKLGFSQDYTQRSLGGGWAKRTESPETFANNLFEQTDRNLA